MWSSLTIGCGISTRIRSQTLKTQLENELEFIIVSDFDGVKSKAVTNARPLEI